MELREFLHLFHPLSEQDFLLLTRDLKCHQFSKGQVLVAPGQIQRDLFFIQKGVQMSYHETDEKIHVIAFTYPPNLCAIPESFNRQKPSGYYLKCLTDTEVMALSFDRLQELFALSREIETLFRKMTEAILAGMINRHIELHAQDMATRFQGFCQRSPHLLKLAPHKYLASYLGIDPTNFSKLFNSIRI